MTIDEIKKTLAVVEENLNCYDCLYYTQMEDCPNDSDCIIATAFHKAIASLEAWDKVKAEIIAESDNKNNNLPFNLGLLAALAIINGHFKEVGNGQTE